MEYKVVPFNAVIGQKDGAAQAAKQLQTLIDTMKSEGWDYVEMANIDTYVEGTNGCLGFGAKPGYGTSVAAVVFKK